MAHGIAKTVRFFAIVTALLVLLGVLLASSMPDGLERIAETLGFAGRAEHGAAAWSPFAGYEAAFVESSWLAQVAAGALGVALLWGLGALLGTTLKKRGEG
jgi:hypothetical protein